MFNKYTKNLLNMRISINDGNMKVNNEVINITSIKNIQLKKNKVLNIETTNRRKYCIYLSLFGDDNLLNEMNSHFKIEDLQSEMIDINNIKNTILFLIMIIFFFIKTSLIVIPLGFLLLGNISLEMKNALLGRLKVGLKIFIVFIQLTYMGFVIIRMYNHLLFVMK